jgi:polysaccharide export outer membrane protein
VVSRIPYVNRLFKNVGYSRETEHVILMVTPRVIIEAAEEAAPAPKPIATAVKKAKPVADTRAADKGETKVASLVKQYQEACAAGEMDKATKLAVQALAIDPACFSKVKADAKRPVKQQTKALPPYVIEAPDVLSVDVTLPPILNGTPSKPVSGQILVRPDGTIAMGTYGEIHVAGQTLEQAREAIRAKLAGAKWIECPADQIRVAIDVVAFNSKAYYVITRGLTGGETVLRLPVTGNETVLDAVSNITAAKINPGKVWVARRDADGGKVKILPVDWAAITRNGETETNYQILPGDRVYIETKAGKTAAKAPVPPAPPVTRTIGPDGLERIGVDFNITIPEKAAPAPKKGAKANDYSTDPTNLRIHQMLDRSEDLRGITEQWRKFWIIDQPSDLTPERVHGGIQ